MNYKLTSWLVFIPLLLSLVFSSGVDVFSFVYAQEKSIPLTLPQVETTRGTLNLGDFSGGLNLKAFPTQLKDNEAQTLVNAWWDKFGALGRRKGYTHFPIPDSAMGINGLFRYYQQDGDRYLLVGGDTALYRAKDDSTSFVKIKSSISTGGDFGFTTYKNNLIASHKNMITITYNGSAIYNLGILDSIIVDSIYTSACTTIYRSGADKGWDANEWVGYLWYNPLNGDENNSYELICKNTSDKIYTLSEPNLIQNTGAELYGITFWEQVSADFERFYLDGYSHSGDRAFANDNNGAGVGQGRQIIKNVKDSSTYTLTTYWCCSASSNGIVRILKGSDTSQVILSYSITSCGAGACNIGGNWYGRSDTFQTGSEESVYVSLTNSTNLLVLWDDISIERYYHPDPSVNFLLLNWWSAGTVVESDTVDSTIAEDCRDYLVGVSNTSWDNHFIEITSGNARGEKRLIKNGNTGSYIEPPFNESIESATYKIYPLSFYQPYYCTVFRNSLILARDDSSGNIVYYSEANEWNFPALNFFTTYTPDGSQITGLMTLYNDQSGQRSSSEDKLLIFKENDILGCDENFLPYVIATGVGATASRSIVNVGGKFVGFAHTTGYYGTDGNTVSDPPLSESIKPFWDNINKTAIDKIACGYYDRHIVCSIPYGTSTENDTGLIYNIDNKSWSTANIKASVFANQWGLQDTIKFLWGRPDTGWVCRYGVSNFDNGTDTITLSYKSKEFDLGDLSQRKSFKEMFLAYDKSLDLTLNYYKDFGSTAIWSKTVTGTGKDIKKILIPNTIYGKTLSWGLSSKDPDITIGNIQIKFSFVGGL